MEIIVIIGFALVLIGLFNVVLWLKNIHDRLEDVRASVTRLREHTERHDAATRDSGANAIATGMAMYFKGQERQRSDAHHRKAPRP